ncbi:MAG: hypothetical protein HY362_01175 [Candidatus Aenigmarchaeota archaeon]|nr:hypothetical protein [Candidatus Aenigmarchaeota archaeon]
MAEGYGNRGREYDQRVLETAAIEYTCPVTGKPERLRPEVVKELLDRGNEKPHGPFKNVGEMLRHVRSQHPIARR